MGPPSRLGGGDDHDADVAEMDVGLGYVGWALRPLRGEPSGWGRATLVGEVGAMWAVLARGDDRPGGRRRSRAPSTTNLSREGLEESRGGLWNTSGVLAMPICRTPRAPFRSVACPIGHTARAHLTARDPQGCPQIHPELSTGRRPGSATVRRMPNSPSAPRPAEEAATCPGTHRIGHAAYGLGGRWACAVRLRGGPGLRIREGLNSPARRNWASAVCRRVQRVRRMPRLRGPQTPPTLPHIRSCSRLPEGRSP
jgi:hypothetical protein